MILDLIAELRALATRVAASHGLEIFDLQFRRESTGVVLRVILDRVPGAGALAEAAGGARGPRGSTGSRRPELVEGREDSESRLREGSGETRRSEADAASSAGVGGGRAPRALNEDSVGIADCQRVSQDLSALLDVEEERLGLPDVKYTLEVSSPGLDRPLRGEADYRRFEGRLAKVVTVQPVDGQSSFAGRLSGVEGAHVLLTEGRRTHRVPLTSIKRARLDVEF